MKTLDRRKTFALIRRLAEKNPETVRLYQENEAALSSTIERIGDVLGAVAMERSRQEKKWGIQDLPDRIGRDYSSSHAFCMAKDFKKSSNDSWQHVLFEEVWEALAENDPEKIAEELIQVAAVCVSWIEALANREKL